MEKLKRFFGLGRPIQIELNVNHEWIGEMVNAVEKLIEDNKEIKKLLMEIKAHMKSL